MNNVAARVINRMINVIEEMVDELTYKTKDPNLQRLASSIKAARRAIVEYRHSLEDQQ